MVHKSIPRFLGGALVLILLALTFLSLPHLAGAQSAAKALITPAAPTATTWYFAEGRVGGGFKQFLTISNPGTSACNVNINYLYTVDGSITNSSKVVSASVPAQSRFTESVNTDLGFSELNLTTGANVAAIVSVNNGVSSPLCTGIVAERPMYFYFHNIQSGTDTLGGTSDQLSTTYFFADVPTGIAGETFLSVLNPGSVTANIIATYYANGGEVAHQTLSVPALSRGTFQPNNLNMAEVNVAATITSDQPILVERPSYFRNVHNVNGAANITGATGLASTWTFAEGTTASGTQENLLIANLGSAAITATITLTPEPGSTAPLPLTVSVPAKTQVLWDVNAHSALAFKAGVTVTESGTNDLVVQRQMFTTYHGSNGANSSSTMQTTWASQGVTDTLGATSPRNTFSFAEGFTSVDYNEWLMITNTSGGPETIDITLNNMLGHQYVQQVTVPPNSRFSDNITTVVEQHLAATNEDGRAYAVSMTVTADNGIDTFVAERTMYFHTPLRYAVQGASSIVGYSGSAVIS